MTPIRRQYLKIKDSYPDAIVLFRLGDFYETFDDDARLASRELEITLTSRSMGKGLKVPMAGVPAHSVESYLARLIQKGHQVAICEQLTDPSVSKGLVDRDVVRVVTPGTVLESSLLEHKVNNYLAAVAEDGRLAGLAYVDITTGEFAAAQMDLEQVPLELERIAPAEVLAPGGDPSGWAPPPWATGVSAVISPVNPVSFDHETAREALLSHYRVLTLESFGAEGQPLAVQAAGAIVSYLSRTVVNERKSAPLRLQNLAVYSTAGYMALDARTRRNLELFEGGRGDDKGLSLLAALDRTRTAMGGRLLRQWLGRPLLDLAGLEQRLDAVEWFFQDGLTRSGVASVLGGVADLERIVGRVVARTAAPRELLALKSALEAVPELRNLLTGARLDVEPGHTGTLEWLQARLVPVNEAAALIEQAIDPDPSGEVGQGNVIRAGFSPEIDELKEASANARGYIAGLESRERERTGIRSLKVGYNHVFGYYIEVGKSNIASLPDDYIRRQTLAHAERYIVPELKEFESVVLNARERLEEAERAVYQRVNAQLAGWADNISRLAAAVAQLDVFSALAQAAVENDYVRPRLNTGPAVEIKDGRHPVVERVLGHGRFVANDAVLASDNLGGARVIVLTGPNMAGKSTYIRQVALIVLMAQVGSFVPASQATIGLVDRIFTRVGLQDDLATGQSTFMVEMVETAAIVNQATPRSLIILDEIGRGTSTYDGLSIARSVIEHLHNDPRLGCKTLFATHYHELTQLAGSLPGVRNFSVAVAEDGNEVAFLHRIVPGGADKSYGVHVARLAGLPQGVINRAWEVLSEMESANGAPRPGGGRAKGPPAAQISLFSGDSPLTERIRELDIPNLTPLEALNKLYELQRLADSQP